MSDETDTTGDNVTELYEGIPFGIVRKPGQIAEPSEVLDDVAEQDLEQVVVVGVYPDGQLYLMSSHNEPEMTVALSKALHLLMSCAQLKESEDP